MDKESCLNEKEMSDIKKKATAALLDLLEHGNHQIKLEAAKLILYDL